MATDELTKLVITPENPKTPKFKFSSIILAPNFVLRAKFPDPPYVAMLVTPLISIWYSSN